jgi:threonine/homoserine/homoserine lactone efflux protein
MLIIVPGQDMILVMSRSIAQGAVAGVATAAGAQPTIALNVGVVIDMA